VRRRRAHSKSAAKELGANKVEEVKRGKEIKKGLLRETFWRKRIGAEIA